MTCSNSNASSSIDQELADEVVISLLMLSRGVPNLAGTSSIFDTDQITDYQVRNLGNPNSSNCGNVEFGGDEQKRVELEDYVDGFSRIDSSGTEMAELSKGLRNGTGSETFKFNPRKKARLADAFDPELKVIPCIKIKVSKVFDDLLKEGKYKCRAYDKIFYSHQALGCYRSCYHNLEVGGRKSKVHQFPICFRVFASGQALGGHMGAHSVANTGVKVREAIHLIIDLLLRKKSSMVMLASTNAG